MHYGDYIIETYYRDYRLWRPNTENPYYLYMYIDPIGRPYTKIMYIYKSFCKTNLIAKTTN